MTDDYIQKVYIDKKENLNRSEVDDRLIKLFEKAKFKGKSHWGGVLNVA